MELISLKYIQDRGAAREWALDELSFGKVNLLVGRNASGKSRALNVVKGFAELVSGRTPFKYRDGQYEVVFSNGGKKIEYLLSYAENKIIKEVYRVDGKEMLDRGVGGQGKIFAEKANAMIEFQSPDNVLAVVNRRDSLQHSYFSPLYDWGQSVYYYAFGTLMGKNSLAILAKEGAPKLDAHNWEQIIAIYKNGKADYGTAFESAVIADMGRIGYELEKIELKRPAGISIEGAVLGELVGIAVKEKRLNDITDQNDMSQGMFRALSILINLNYSQFASLANCVLIDDIGEGLDFERSFSLIKLLREKSKASNVQLVMTTNDRFVMNAVPLEEWTLLDCRSGKIIISNYSNSKEKFDNFKFTGLNNFDFLATGFLNDESQKHT